MFSKRIRNPLLMLGLVLVLAGCPRGVKLPEQSGIGGLLAFDYAGIEVLHQYSARDFVHVRLQFGWRSSLEASHAAQMLAVEGAFTCGAGKFSALEFAARREAIGVEMVFLQQSDGPVVVMNCLPEQLGAAWELLSLCLLDPRFDRDAFQAVRNARVSASKTLEADGLYQATMAAKRAAWPGLEWDAYSLGTAADLEQIARSTAQITFTEQMRVRCNLRLVTVGPIDAERISDLLAEASEALPEGLCPEPPAVQTLPVLRAARLVQASKDAESLAGVFPGPSASSAEAITMQLVMKLVARRLRAQLLKKDRVALSVDAAYNAHFPSHNIIEITGVNAFQCAEFALSELRRLKAGGFNAKEISEGKQALLAELALGYETANGLAARLDNAAAVKALALTGNEKLIVEAASLKVLNATLEKYLTGITWGIVGDTTRVDRKSLQRL